MSRAAARLASRLGSLEHFGVKLGLERIETLLAALGEPHRRLEVVLVAGTNGKGSTAAALASIVTAAGYKTGLYTSPHLEGVEERIRVDGAEIDTTTLADLIDEVVEASERLTIDRPTYFETLTAAALCQFDRAAVDLAILEVGMGGRLDATNVCQPNLSLITPIGLDHERHLGATTAAIAREKAGILRTGRVALAVASEGAACRMLERRAAAIGAHLTIVPVESLVSARRATPRHGQVLEIETGRDRYRLRTRFEGRHQADNLVLAAVAAERLIGLGFGRIDRAAVERGTAAVRWPGRLEWVGRPTGTEVLLDAAHNTAGWRALERYLDEVGEPFDLLFGVLRDKLGSSGADGILKQAVEVVLTTPPSDRALPAQDLGARVGRAARVVDDPAQALERALTTDRLLVVCGSLYLVGAIRRELRGLLGRPPHQRTLFTG